MSGLSGDLSGNPPVSRLHSLTERSGRSPTELLSDQLIVGSAAADTRRPGDIPDRDPLP